MLTSILGGATDCRTFLQRHTRNLKSRLQAGRRVTGWRDSGAGKLSAEHYNRSPNVFWMNIEALLCSMISPKGLHRCGRY